MMRRPFHNCQEKIVGFLFSFFLSLFLCFLVLINFVVILHKNCQTFLSSTKSHLCLGCHSDIYVKLINTQGVDRSIIDYRGGGGRGLK